MGSYNNNCSDLNRGYKSVNSFLMIEFGLKKYNNVKRIEIFFKCSETSSGKMSEPIMNWNKHRFEFLSTIFSLNIIIQI